MSGVPKSKKKLLLVVVSAVFFVLLAGGSTWLIISKNSSHAPFSKKFISSVSFPLYYPTSLPSGYSFDKQSLSTDGITAHYKLTNSAKKVIISVTMQATPSGFDAAKIIGKTSIPNTVVSSGTLYNLSIGGASKYMFTTGVGTLMFITSAKTIPTTDINEIAKNLQQVK